MIIPDSVKRWLAPLISEHEAKKMTGGTRQNWLYRKPKLRQVAGIEILPGVWVYEKEPLLKFLSQTARPSTRSGKK